MFDPLDPDISKALKSAARLLSIRHRSVHEMENHLKKKFNSDTIENTIQLLKQDRYLDDRRFAQLFIESRIHNNPKSKYLLGKELSAKKVAPEIIEEHLFKLDDRDLAESAVNRKLRIWMKTLDENRVKNKVFNYLGHRGFGFQVIHDTWERVRLRLIDNDLLC